MDLAAELAAARENYTRGGLHEHDLAADPFLMFEKWYAEARDAGLVEPNAMVVSTVSAAGAPSSRMVLLKDFSESGFTFFTNTASRKGEELAANPRCAVLFPWHPLERQVRIDGIARPVPAPEVEAYFMQRPRGSRIGAHASHQSRVVTGREELEADYEAAEGRFADEPVPVPEEWGGYRVEPEAVEFWQGRPGRLHDRLRYVREGEAWRTERLAP